MPARRGQRVGRKVISQMISHMEGLSLAQSDRIVKLMCDQIMLHVLNGSRVYLPQLGKFHAVYVPARMGQHPITKEPLPIKHQVRLIFQTSGPMKEWLNQYVETFAEFAESDIEQSAAERAKHPLAVWRKRQLEQAMLADEDTLEDGVIDPFADAPDLEEDGIPFEELLADEDDEELTDEDYYDEDDEDGTPE